MSQLIYSCQNLSCFDLIKQTTDLKKSGQADWLKECPAQSLQMALRNLDNAYTRFFKGSGFPKFKKRSHRQSIHFPQDVKVCGDKITFPKLKDVSFILHRPLKIGKIKTVTISKTATNKYFVVLQIEDNITSVPKKNIKEHNTVGIDVGLKTFATLSDGTSFNSPLYFREQLQLLRIEQRKLHRKFKRGAKEQSKGYQKQKLIVAKLHEKIVNRRKDFLQKTSTAIIKQYNTICLEDLNIKGMMQNRQLAKSISDVSWYEFSRMLEYKAEWYGKNIIYIGRFDPSSKICSTCGTINKELKLSDRTWTCKCGVTHDRDKNAALNIKNFGLRNQPNIVNVSH